MLATNSQRIMLKLIGAWCTCSALWVVIGIRQYRCRLHNEKARVATLTLINQALQIESQQLADQVILDPLTGALNRQGLRDVLLKREQGDKTAYFDAVLFIDLDHFKRINDQFGHDVGDQVLQTFAMTVSARIRESDKLVRWGGEEFLILCAGVNGKKAAALAQQLCNELARTSWPHALQVTASIGVADIGGKTDIGSAIRRADDALYAAKRNGRNRVEIAAEELADAP
jgi:diguanylate cyclase (GGDEF)-like protein